MQRIPVFVLALVCYAPLAAAQDRHICYIDRVEIEGEGLRIFYTPDYTKWRPNVETGEFLKVGDHTTASLMAHDRCVIMAVRKDGMLGVEAKSSWTMVKYSPPELSIPPIKDLPFPYIPPSPTSSNSHITTKEAGEWIEAVPNPAP